MHLHAMAAVVMTVVPFEIEYSPSPPPPSPPPQPDFVPLGGGACSVVGKSNAHIRIAAPEHCISCRSACLDTSYGLSDWHTADGKGQQICRAMTCGHSYCVLHDAEIEDDPLPTGATGGLGGQLPDDVQCIRHSVRKWQRPPMPPSPPPPPAPLLATGCDGQISLAFPPIEDKLASLGDSVSLDLLPENVKDKHQRCDASSYEWYALMATTHAAMLACSPPYRPLCGPIDPRVSKARARAGQGAPSAGVVLWAAARQQMTVAIQCHHLTLTRLPQVRRALHG